MNKQAGVLWKHVRGQPMPASQFFHRHQSLRLIHFGDHVVHDVSVLMLRTKQNEIGILFDFYRMSRWPVKQVICAGDFRTAVGVRRGQFPLDDISPVRGMAHVSFQPLQQWRYIHSGGERKILAADFPIAGGVAEIQLLACGGSRNANFDGNIILGDMHDKLHW